MPNKISVDEIISRRKDLSSDKSPVLKLAKAPPSWSPDRRSARFVMNAQAPDRYSDIVITAGIKTDEFEQNPVGLLFHNSQTWPVATWSNLEKILKGRPPRLEGDFDLLPAGGPVKEIEETEWMIANGGIRACSIGFLPNWDMAEMILDEEGKWGGGIQWNEITLLETSICAVPASPQALIKAADHGIRMAHDLIEDILDNWTRTPAGLLVSRAEFEAAQREANGNHTSIVVNKDASEEACKPKKEDDPDDPEMEPCEDETKADEASQDGTEAPRDAVVEDGKAVDEGVIKTFLDEAVAGDTLCVVRDVSEVGEESGWVKFAAVPGSGRLQIMKDGVAVQTLSLSGASEEHLAKVAELARVRMAELGAEISPQPEKTVSEIKLKVDGSEVDAELDRLTQKANGLADLIGRIFGHKKNAPERVEPEIVTPPTPDAIAAAKQRASDVVAGLKSRNLI